MMIGYNAVYQMETNGKRIRIINIDLSAGTCAYISLEGSYALPVLCPCEDLIEMLDNEEMKLLIHSMILVYRIAIRLKNWNAAKSGINL